MSLSLLVISLLKLVMAGIVGFLEFDCCSWSMMLKRRPHRLIVIFQFLSYLEHNRHHERGMCGFKSNEGFQFLVNLAFLQLQVG